MTAGSRTDPVLEPAAHAFVDEADVLRGEGEACAADLRAADVPVPAVRCRGAVHDLVMPPARHQRRTTR